MEETGGGAAQRDVAIASVASHQTICLFTILCDNHPTLDNEYGSRERTRSRHGTTGTVQTTKTDGLRLSARADNSLLPAGL